jgi:hypothetical protein
MAEIEFDDNLLVTQENLAAVDWENIENFGLTAEGRHLATIKKVGGYMFNFKEYTGPRAKVQFCIKEGPDKGKNVYDDINLPHPQEKEGNVKRRMLIASRMGLVQKGSKDTTQVNWKALEGRDVWITVEHSISEKDGKKKTYANVTFDGWEAATPFGGGAQASTKDQYPDI